jgi:threonine aldolase
VNFLSDNASPVAPAVLEAIVQANDGFAIAYGDDEWTRSVERHLSALFEREVAVFLVPTGTAANALAIAHLTPPWGPWCVTPTPTWLQTSAARRSSLAAASS